MRCIKASTDAIRGNIDEARKYIGMAYEAFSTDRPAADWYKEMAEGHLKFNTNGHNVVTKQIDAAKAKGVGSDLLPGMLAVYNIVHSDLIKAQAEVKAMIDNYGK